MYPNRAATAHRRPAFTMIELLVVIAILVMMIAIVALFAPKLGERQKTPKGADQLQGWLLEVKQLAKRDGAPRGVRLYIDPATGYCSQLSFIEQMPDLTGGLMSVLPKDQRINNAPNVVAFYNTKAPAPNQPTPPPDLTGGSGNPNDWSVQPGDYLEITDKYGIQLYVIQNPIFRAGTRLLAVTVDRPLQPLPTIDTYAKPISPNSIQVQDPTGITANSALYLDQPRVFGIPPANVPAPNPKGLEELRTDGSAPDPSGIITFSDTVAKPLKKHANPFPVRLYRYPYQTESYRIIRKPRLVAGAQPLKLPDRIVISKSLSILPGLPAIPATDPDTGMWLYDILFDTTGALLFFNGASSNKVIFWVQDSTLVGEIDPATHLPGLKGDQILVGVYVKTGLIASHPADPNNPANAFDYFQDGRASGL